jgi:hypothetical protein
MNLSELRSITSLEVLFFVCVISSVGVGIIAVYCFAPQARERLPLLITLGASVALPADLVNASVLLMQNGFSRVLDQATAFFAIGCFSTCLCMGLPLLLHLTERISMRVFILLFLVFELVLCTRLGCAARDAAESAPQPRLESRATNPPTGSVTNRQ